MLVLTQPPLSISNKGFIQPHRNNLPRRHRQKFAPPKLTLEPPPVFLPVPFPVTLAPAAAIHSPAPPANQPTGPLQPHISHLPRRRHRRLHTRHYHALAPARRKKKLERDMCMQRVASGVWVAFCPPRDASPYSSEDDVDEGYRYGGGEERAAWYKGLEERFGRIVTIVDTTVSASPSSGGLMLTLEGAGAGGHDDGVALLTDAQIREGCAFLRGSTTTPPSPSPPRYSSFPPSPPPPPHHHHSPGGSTNARVLILAPRARAVDALSLAAAYAVARGPVKGQAGPGGVHTPPRTPSSSRCSSSSTKVLPPDTTFSALSCADTHSNSAQDDAELDLDLTHPIAEWSARVIPSPRLPLQPEIEIDEGYTPVHALLMRLHDLDCQGGEEEEEEEEEEEGGLRDEWRGVLSWEGMWRVWDVVRGDE